MLLLLGCGNSSKSKVAFLHPSKNRARFMREGQFMVERLKQLGAEPLMIDADDNEALQIEKGMKLLDDGVDLLIVTAVNGNTIAPLIRKAKEMDVPVIAFNRLINNTDYDLFITGDNTDLASILCKEALKAKPKGNYIILNGDRFDRNGVEVKQTIDSLLKPHIASGDIKIIYESSIELWTKENAKYEFEQAIQANGTDIDAVICCSDPMSIGVLEILKKYNVKNNVFITGQDAELENVKGIYNGDISISIYHPHKILGYKTAEAAMEILKGTNPKKIANATTFNGTDNIPTLKIKSVLINKDNIGSELVDKGEYTWSQIQN